MTGGPQVTDVLGLLEDVREASAPQQWIALCPAHDDRSPSLSVRLADDGRWLVHCFAGCSAGEICAPLGITLRDLFPKDGPKGHRGLHRHVLTASERLELI
ncbi:MAG: CHC2 zinc finger domain-containing protein, partial [Gammaproteobacteria bacterium]|nr:CHC2 zinc finger domain-containing protein [Gammaproteobacteria bacterium]